MLKTKKMSSLHQVEWLRVVLDEGHCIRNVTSSQSKACVALKAERRWFVTGIYKNTFDNSTILAYMMRFLYFYVFFLFTELFKFSMLPFLFIITEIRKIQWFIQCLRSC